MAELKTKPSGVSVREFIDGIEDEQRRKDCRKVMQIMKRVTGAGPKMWGSSIVGYGSYRYKYASGREGEWMLTGFSPRKQALTLYIMAGIEDGAPLMKELGKHTTGKSCLYIKRLDDVDLEVLEALVRSSVERVQRANA